MLDLGSGESRVEVRPDHAGIPWALVGRRRLPLSISHAPGWAVAAAHARLPVGVDVEAVRPLPRRFSRYFLHPAELAVLEGWGHRASASLAGWTVKEAVLKAMGRGLCLSPLDVRIRSIDTEGSVGVTAEGADVAAACWREAGAVVAVAWAGTAVAPIPRVCRSEI